MKKLGILIVLLLITITLLSCTTPTTETEEIPDLSTYTEAEVSGSMLDKIYKLEDVHLTSENSIYMVVGENTYKGTFISWDDEGTLFSIEEEITLHDWWYALEDQTVKGYYK